MALQGTLDTFALPDVLRLLAATTKTGRLQITGDRGTGEVWLDHGDVVGGVTEATAADTSDVVFELLRHTSGSFEFAAQDSIEGAHDPIDVDQVIGEAEAKLADWRTVEAVVPSLDCTATLVGDLPGDSISFDAAQWRTLVAIGFGATVNEIDSHLDLGEIEVSRAVKSLADAGVVTVTEPAPAAPEVFDLTATNDHGIEFFTDPVAPADFATSQPDAEALDGQADAQAETGAGQAEAADAQAESADAQAESADAEIADAGDRADGQEQLDTEAAGDTDVAAGGSCDVDLDAALDAIAADHSYLTAGEEGDANAAMPEPLLEPGTEVEVAAEAGEAPEASSPAATPEPQPVAAGDDNEPSAVAANDENADVESGAMPAPEPATEVAAPIAEAADGAAVVELPAPVASVAELTASDSAEVGRQLSKLSPKAARAIKAAAAGPSGDDAGDAKAKRPAGARPEEPMNRNLLMKFISSK